MNNKRQKVNIVKSVIMILLAIFLFVPSAYASEITSDNVVKLVNKDREAQGLATLSENETLAKIAQDKLNDMIENNYFAHTSPKGVNPWFWYEKEKYDYKYAGENLAINFLKAEDQQKAWMNSPTHRKNILNSNYQEIGVAVGAGEINGQTSIIAVQEFGTQIGATGVPSDGKNFSTSSAKPKEEIGMTPQVLSVKTLTGENLKNNQTGDQGKNYLSDLFGKLKNNREVIAYKMSELAVVLFIVSLFLSAATFMAVAINEILESEEIRRKALRETLRMKKALAH